MVAARPVAAQPLPDGGVPFIMNPMIFRSSLLAAALAATALVPAAASAEKVAPDVKKLAITPAALAPTPSGGPVTVSGGARVTFQLLDGADVSFSVKSELKGKRAGKTCVAGKPKTKKGACVRTVDVPGGWLFVGITGPNEFQFSGRLADKPLAPGLYRLVAKAEGTAARSSFTRFRILK